MKHNYDEVFFPSGHFHLSHSYLLELSTLCEEDKVNLVCRHQDGYWNAVSADQFGEQTAIKIGKGSLKGMTLYTELVSEWIDSFPITAYVSDRMDHIYADHIPVVSSQKQHKEEFKHRRILDAYDRNLIYAEVEKYPHPLEDDCPNFNWPNCTN